MLSSLADRPTPVIPDDARTEDWWHPRMPLVTPRGLAPLRELAALPREYNAGPEVVA
jgi:hypothetical protein